MSGPKVTASSHDDSKVTAEVHGGTFKSKSYDRSLTDIRVGGPADVENPTKQIDWTKWGTILSSAAILVSIVIAVIN
ncbi:MAG: hypothetical protein Pars2KO_29850 [Parasphingorhabdus sp.]